MIYRTAEGGQAIVSRYRELLDGAAVEQVRVMTSFGESFVVCAGPVDGPPLVLLHGSGGNAAMWLAALPDWSAYFRVYAVDLLGEPGLSAPVRPPLESYPDWLAQVLAALGVDRTALVGVSLGGWLALAFASRHPDRVGGLVAISPSGIGRQKYAVLAAALFLLPFGDRGRLRTLRLVLGTTLPAAVTDYLLLIHRTFRPRRDRIPVLPDAALRSLTMPVRVVVGARDRLLDSRGTHRRMTGNAPNATVTVLPDAGHYVELDRAGVLEFLRRPGMAW